MLGPGAGGDGKGVGCLAGHAEPALVQRGRHVLAGLARQGQLEIVDGGGPVHGHGLDQSLANPVDQVRATARLDDGVLRSRAATTVRPSAWARARWKRTRRSDWPASCLGRESSH